MNEERVNRKHCCLI